MTAVTPGALGMTRVYLPDGQEVWVSRHTAADPSWRGNALAKGVVPVGEPAVSTQSLSGLAQSVGANNVVMGPGMPVAPSQTREGEPRRWDYMPGVNTVTRPRSFEAYTFETLRAFCDNYDVARLCIEKRKDDLRGLVPQIRPRPVEGITRQERKDQRSRLEGAINDATGFLLTPDQERSWAPWLMKWAEDLFAIDSATIYLRPTLDGGLFSLEVPDGSTFRPLIDQYGRSPQPPDPAYVQVIRGVPWGWYTREEIIQEPYWPRTNSPYGHPPIEWVLMAANRALRRQTRDLTNFTDGNMPAGLLHVPENWNMTQIRELFDFLDMLLSGNDAMRSKMIPVPGGPGTPFEKLTEEPSTEGEEWLLYLTCWAFGVSPSEIGYSRAGSGLGGKGFAEVQQDLSFRRSVRNPGLHLKGIIDGIIARVPAWAELEIHFPGLEDASDTLTKAQANDIEWQRGVLSTDEWREETDRDPIGLGPTVVSGNAVVTIEELLKPPNPVPAVLAPFAGVDNPPADDSAPVAEETGTPGNEAPETPSAEPGQLTDGEEVATAAKVGGELDAWRRKSLRAHKAGRSAGVAFVSTLIPDDVRTGLSGALAKASSPADIHAAFNLAKAGASAHPFGPETTSSTPSGASSPSGSATRPTVSYRGWNP